ncbi:class I SAM-dependent methyltransferase [Algoriphagus yeomjeoni]|uniref:Methyltransferase family protein n=1 Tax=Algoriphagus yeomjeoni TaxID=291403 RepID=A0A327P1K3_9BACT|nr:class I SAM-dependent methyltransferase [Algoriphagus yeomjeoni]RAI85583.1 hypothetical protein LV83_03663 [Algoriphagus yeomjeoni]
MSLRKSNPFSILHILKKSIVSFKLFLFRNDLKYAAQVFHSDKFHVHNYIPYYVHFFSSLRKKKNRILEIGIGGYDDPKLGGASLRLWKNYFSNSQIFGIDLYDKSQLNQHRIKTFKGSQIDSGFLNQVVSEVETFDIIIDDGSHISSHVIFTFEYLFPFLTPGGFYVIEDLQTSYWEEYNGGFQKEGSSIEYFKGLMDSINSIYIRDKEVNFKFENEIEFFFMRHNILFIKKK